MIGKDQKSIAIPPLTSNRKEVEMAIEAVGSSVAEADVNPKLKGFFALQNECPLTKIMEKNRIRAATLAWNFSENVDTFYRMRDALSDLELGFYSDKRWALVKLVLPLLGIRGQGIEDLRVAMKEWAIKFNAAYPCGWTIEGPVRQ